MSLRIGIGLGLIPTAARPAATTAPVNVVKPSFDGPLTQGQSADVNPGSWTGLPSPNFTYAIKRGATTVSTDPAYVWTSADVAAGVGAMTVAVTATNDIDPTTATSDPVTIAGPLVIGGIPSAAIVGQPYSHTFTFTGGHAPRVSALNGTLQSGLSYDGTTHTISGTAVSSGIAEDLSLDGVDGDGLTASFGPFDLIASAGNNSAITAFEIMDATPLDATGAYADATERLGIDGNGWVGRAMMPWLAGQTFDPTKIAITVTDPGFDAAGATTVSRTVYGGAVLRRQYTAQTSRQQANDGLTLTVYFSLQGQIYEGSTVVSAVAGAGFYGSAQAGLIGNRVNQSTVAYPKPLVAFLNRQYDRATGALAVEVAAYHAHARNGRQVARVEFVAKDAQATPNVSATQVANAPALSSIQTRGGIVESYKAAIPLGDLQQGDVCTVNAKVYPWIGDASAVLDLEADGVAWPTANPQTLLHFLNDKAGTYGGAIAYVKAGAAGGTVSLSDATARAAPFPTILAALAAVKAFNNANRGHNDHSGAAVFLMDDGAGGAVAHAVGGSLAAITAGNCWTEIKVDPLATGAVSVSLTATIQTADLLAWNVNISHTGGNGLDGVNTNGNVRAAFDSLDLAVAATAVPINYRCGLTYVRNVTLTGATAVEQIFGVGYSTTRTQTALMLGVICEDATVSAQVKPFTMIGCRFKRIAFIENNYASIPNLDSSDGAVIANNRLLDVRLASVWGNLQNITRGFALVQNVLERAVAASSIPALQVGGDDAARPMANVVMAHNTIPGVDTGARLNNFYNDSAGSVGVIKRGVQLFNIWAEYNCKTDTFTTKTTLRGRVGNWRNRYGVDYAGNVIINGDSNGGGGGAGFGAVDPDGGNWLGEYMPPGNVLKAGVANVPFVNNKSGAAGAGGGDYALSGAANAAYARVPAGMAVLSYDLAGVARLNDGSGAAGAHERTA